MKQQWNINQTTCETINFYSFGERIKCDNTIHVYVDYIMCIVYTVYVYYKHNTSIFYSIKIFQHYLNQHIAVSKTSCDYKLNIYLKMNENGKTLLFV